jgi:hypothetical protein
VPRKVNPDTQEVTGKMQKDIGAAIDREFQAMTFDREYQDEALRIAEEFLASDAETISIAEKELSKP